MVYVALLRGINVGGRHKLPMNNLLALFEDAGCRAARSYIQSGNVVFEAPAALVRRVPTLIAAAIAGEFGFEVPVVMRTAAELRKVVVDNPFARAGVDPATLAVAFLADRPTKARVARLDPKRSPSDEFIVRGREIYLRMPNGVARSKLTNAYFDATLGTTSTARNWNTTRKLLELTGLAD